MTFPLWAWAAFTCFVLAVLALDLFVLHRSAREVSLREAGLWSAIWVVFGVGFGVLLWAWRGGGTAQAYLAGYLIEKSLSVDNVFVYAVIFSMFAVAPRYQHRMLMYGILGALGMRAVFITSGAALLGTFHPTVYLFGALLLYTAIQTLRPGGREVRPDQNVAVRVLRRVIPVTGQPRGQRFIVREDGRWLATPLLVALVAVETTDVIFAVDSIPAIFAITTDTFVVFTSNVFALLGMRSLYFLLAGAARRFRYLQPGIGVILAGVAVKMLLTDIYATPIWAAPAFVAAVLSAVAALSLRDASRSPARTCPRAGARPARQVAGRDQRGVRS